MGAGAREVVPCFRAILKGRGGLIAIYKTRLGGFRFVSVGAGVGGGEGRGAIRLGVPWPGRL